MPAGLLPLARPLMTAEVLDAAFRLFRAGILRCLPYSGLAVLVLELPTLYSTFLIHSRQRRPARDSAIFRLIGYATVFLLSVALLGVITLRLNAVAQGLRPRFRREIAIALKRLADRAARHAVRLRLSAGADRRWCRCSTQQLADRGADLRRGAAAVAGGAVRGRAAGILVRWPRTRSRRLRGRCACRFGAPGAWSASS